MQFNIDSHSEFKEIFTKLREVFLSYPQIKEKRNAKQTAYYDACSAIGFLRPHNDGMSYCLSLANGHTLQKNYPMLKGNGKIARHLYFKCSDDIDVPFIREIIEESLVLNIEKSERKKLKKKLRS